MSTKWKTLLRFYLRSFHELVIFFVNPQLGNIDWNRTEKLFDSTLQCFYICVDWKWKIATTTEHYLTLSDPMEIGMIPYKICFSLKIQDGHQCSTNIMWPEVKKTLKYLFLLRDYKQWNNNRSPNNKQIIDNLTSGTILSESLDRKKKDNFICWLQIYIE